MECLLDANVLVACLGQADLEQRLPDDVIEKLGPCDIATTCSKSRKISAQTSIRSWQHWASQSWWQLEFI